ncbi:MAG: 50S ribosomal protein L4 [bacterium]|nr:50S ribosomal protein L4 [bacterium]
MEKISILNQSGKQVGELKLNKDIFSGPVNKTVLADSVKAYLNNQRHGTSDTKVRSEVRGGGRKPWKQKGTGSARVGSIRSPLWRGGAIIFGPHPRSLSYQLPKKVKKIAIKSALTDKLISGKIKVLDDIVFEQPKTKSGLGLLKALNVSGKILLILADKTENVVKSMQNISGVNIIYTNSISVYSLVNCDEIVTTAKALKNIEELLG